MPVRSVTLPDGVPAPLRDGLTDLMTRLKIATDFSSEVLAEAKAARPAEAKRVDLTDLPFVTLDPEGSTDLDQAIHLSKQGSGFRLRYAIADVAAFVAPNGAVAQESFERGQTVYAPGARYPLHPPVLSEGAASLLADGKDRPAAVWTIDLDADGAVVEGRVERAWVRNRAQLSYTGAQADLDAGRTDEMIRLIAEVGRLRQEQEAARGGASLNLPDQEIVSTDRGWELDFRQMEPIENWNAQISLLTGHVAALLMLEAGTGVLRTLPPAEEEGVERLRRVAQGLGISWPQKRSYPEFLRTLDITKPTHLAMMTSCTTLFRGADYEVFSGGAPADPPLHGALAMPYAHVTAPLRRLVDRFGTEICLSHCAEVPVPEWIGEKLESLPETMRRCDSRTGQFERGVISLTEALVLSTRVGDVFEGVVTSKFENRVRVQLADPAVEIDAYGRSALGRMAKIRIESVDLKTGKVRAEVERD
ncbi:MAG: RNB domain-containing ribonuclease [Propionibacteriaceae bacterium]|jgi:exoribonuclease R|nr:RNB domain-containing ribonuclease [Propionibacteriaceae bacterium]